MFAEGGLGQVEARRHVRRAGLELQDRLDAGLVIGGQRPLMIQAAVLKTHMRPVALVARRHWKFDVGVAVVGEIGDNLNDGRLRPGKLRRVSFGLGDPPGVIPVPGGVAVAAAPQADAQGDWNGLGRGGRTRRECQENDRQ